MIVVGAIAALTLVMQPLVAAGEEEPSAAEGDQTNSARFSLQLEGGYPETVVVGSSAVAGTNDMLYAGLNAPNGLFWSNDFGTTWNAMTGGADVGAVIDVAVSETPGTAFMIGGISLYRTQDNGATWVQIDDVSNVAQFFATGADGLLVVPDRNGGISVSTDDGENFTTYTLPGTVDVAVAADNTVLALAGEGDTRTLYVLRDGDSAFSTTDQSGEWSVVVTHPSDATYWLVAGNNEVKITQAGDEGPFDSVSLPDGGVTNGAAVIRANGEIYLGSTVSSDDGATWEQGSGWWNWITFDEVNGYVYSASTRGVGRAESADGPFEDIVTGMTGVTVSDIAQDGSKEVVWLAVQGGFAKTDNFLTASQAGEDPTWEYPITTGGPDGSGVAVWVSSEDSQHVVVSTGSLWFSTDGGETWTASTTDVDGQVTYTTIVDDGSGSMYAGYATDGGGGGVVTSADGGETWTDMAMPFAPVNAIAATPEGPIVAVGAEQDTSAEKRGVYVNVDGSWLHATESPDHLLYGALVSDLLTLNDGTLVVTTSGADEQGILAYSSDAGATWNTLGSKDIPEDFWGQGLAVSTADPNQIFASTARPSGTGYIYSCSLTKDACSVFYTGLVDEQFNAMLFDGLLSGSNVGLFSYQSKANIAAKKLKNKNGKRRIRAVLTDKATGTKLNGRSLKLYRKAKGKFRFFKKKKMKKGQAVFSFGKGKKGTFQVRWTPSGSDGGVYVSAQSSNLK